jgi:hypothetical protein
MITGRHAAGQRATLRPSAEALAGDRGRYDLALGVDLAVAVGLCFIFVLSFLTGSPPSGRLLLAWIGLLAGTAIVITGGVLLCHRDRVGMAMTLLALIAAPAIVVGFALAPFAVAAVIAAASNMSEFRLWAGPDFRSHLPAWLTTLGVLAALIPASLLTRRFGRHMLGIGLALGAIAMISVMVFGIVGGFSFRHMR